MWGGEVTTLSLGTQMEVKVSSFTWPKLGHFLTNQDASMSFFSFLFLYSSSLDHQENTFSMIFFHRCLIGRGQISGLLSQAIEALLGAFVGGGVWEIGPQSALPVVEVQISGYSAEAGMVVAVKVSKVEMYSDVNLHLKRLNAVTHKGEEGVTGVSHEYWAPSASLGKMKVEEDGDSTSESYGSRRKGRDQGQPG